MEQRKEDFNKLKDVLKKIPSGEFTPNQLREFCRNYAKKYIPSSTVNRNSDLIENLLTPLNN